MDHPFFVHEGCVAEEETLAVLGRGTTLFSIRIRHDEIKETPFGMTYLPLVAAYRRRTERHSRESNPFNVLGNHCLPLLQQLAPRSSIVQCTIEDLLQSTTYNLDITGDARILSGPHPTGPVFYLCPVSIAHTYKCCEGVARFRAEDVTICVDGNAGGPQGRIQTEDGSYLYFKPRESGREGQFDRELQILIKIQQEKLGMRLPDLRGIVVSRGLPEECVGLLIDEVSGGLDLLSPRCWAKAEMHSMWQKQVQAIVDALHARGIVWGDVNAGNVVIDEDSNAWVIDFGGMNNPEFVDDDKIETKEGDLQGVRRLFADWLPGRKEFLE